MKIALRKRNFDPVFTQTGLDLPKKIGMDCGGALHGFRSEPDDQFEVQAAIAEPDQPDLGFTPGNFGQRPGDAAGGFQHRFFD